MYILRIFNGYGFDKFLKIKETNLCIDQWEWVDSRAKASELSIWWIQKNLGWIIDVEKTRRVEIIQVRECAPHN